MIKIKRKKSTNEIINIKNIYNNTIYTNDNYIIKILKLENINLQLKSDKELIQLAYNLSSNLQEFLYDIKIQHFTNNLDISNLTDKLNLQIENADSFEKKKFLRNYKNYLIDESMDNNIFEQDTIIIIWQKYDDEKDLFTLSQKVQDIINAFSNLNNTVIELNNNELIKICNMFINNADNNNYSKDIAFI